ncbi:MAG: hypothetical protein AUG51_09300 [Acidobacteria bacterium 13_1_20CM_3_53_8]|nr:MAG: hypothetical protein AUG51_09300 [Acidobacteria bacterium 13_1_20CM_3_53_8]
MASILHQPYAATLVGQSKAFQPESLPHELKDFRDYHAGETVLVCGCGSSLSQVVAPERFITIGVNDVGRLFQPDYLVVLNPPHQFRGDRFRFVEESRARALFMQLDLGINHPHIVHIKLGTRGGVDFKNPNVLHYTRNSPYLALCLAVHMGAKRIGLIGVDFTDNHFFGATGRHPLSGEFPQIEREYKRLYESCRQMGVEVVNLSSQSRLTVFPKMSTEEFARASMLSAPEKAQAEGRKVFFVNYKFLSCGEVFKDGLSHAAEDLKVNYAMVYWDDPQLPAKVKEFSPELLFVVHGRKFSRRWGTTFKDYNTAVWLLDEPYEVDDTARFSNLFNTVFTNDPSTLHRHRNAHYLPVCYDPHHHSYKPGDERKYATGFVGGYNHQREELLDSLAGRGLLSYVVGGPWRKPSVNAVCMSGNIPATETAMLYKETRIVLNVFRAVHHFNRDRIPATALNPRIYEALQCGALVVSQNRPELSEICPTLPVFETADELASTVESLLEDPVKFEHLRRSCIRQLASHTYARRLSTVLNITLEQEEKSIPRSLVSFAANAPGASAKLLSQPLPESLAYMWEHYGHVTSALPDGTIVMSKPMDAGPGTEEGLISKQSGANIALSFELFLERDASFIAKIHQTSATDQFSNSYHIVSHASQAYLARHDHVLRSFALQAMTWLPVRFVYHDRIIAVEVNGEIITRVHDDHLPDGYCFIGLKGGTVRLRNIKVEDSKPEDIRNVAVPPYQILRQSKAQSLPLLSIITTVYDRVKCLEHCLRSVNTLHFQDYEQIVVADCPPAPVLDELMAVVEENDHGKLLFAKLERRFNDWGISPATVGLNLARGKYICFLSDDNGYMPDHLEPLIEVLEKDRNIGFAYSSCLYDGRLTLNYSPPRFGRIDLGQPLFRKELFDLYLDGVLPFTEAAWDWRMIQTIMRGGVRWRHINRPTFIFRLEKYPHLIPAKA